MIDEKGFRFGHHPVADPGTHVFSKTEPDWTPGAGKARSELIRELADVKNRLALKEKRCRQLSREIGRLRSTGLPGTACGAARAEMENLHRRISILEGIDRIFRKSAACRTREQLGRFCLEVAEKLTASQFGFIAEVTGESRLNDIAISYPGRNACRVTDPTGHCIRKANVSGLFERLLRNAKGVYTNNLDVRADVTLPDGHPPLRSFLGIPLIHSGRMFGIMALANGAGGYREPDLMALETLAPIVSQVLLGKQAECLLRESEKRHRRLLEEMSSDIAAHRQSEAALRASEERLRRQLAEFEAIYASSPVGLCVFDTQLRWVRLNQRIADINGVPLEDHIGKTPREIVPDVGEQAEAALRHILETGEPLNFEMSGTTAAQPDVVRYWNERWVPLKDATERIIGVSVAAEEITERKLAEHALRQSETRYRRLVESASEGIWQLDPEFEVREVNERMARMLGYAKEEIVGRHIRDFMAPHELPDVDRRIANRRRGITETFERQLSRKDGSLVWALVSATPLRDDNGDIIGSFGLFTDITKRKMAENALRENESRLTAAMQIANLGIWEYHADTAVARCDARCREIFGISEDHPTAEMDLFAMVHPEDRDRVQAQVRTALTSDSGGLFETEYRINRPDGGLRWVAVRGNIITKAHGDKHVERYTGIVMDITGRKQTEQNLQKQAHRLKQRVFAHTELAETRAKQLQTLAAELIEAEERERHRFATLLHDDLQQLLAAARMQLPGADEPPPTARALAYVAQLLEEAIGKSRRLSHELSPPVLHHSGLVDALKWLGLQMGEQFGMHVDIQTDTDHQLESAALKQFLFRAVQELLFNIVKHSGVKNASVRLSCGDGLLTVTVSDHGRGFDPAILDQSSGEGGFGIMSIRERAGYFGGRLSIQSATGQGCRFTLRVPSDPARPGPAKIP